MLRETNWRGTTDSRQSLKPRIVGIAPERSKPVMIMDPRPEPTPSPPAGRTACERSPQRILLCSNPRSRRAADLLGAAQRVLAGRSQIRTAESTDRGQLNELIRRHAAECDLVVIAGGDGSLNAAAPALLETGLPLGVLPFGTANDLARNLGIPQDPQAAAEVVLSGAWRAIDIGTANGRPFFNAAHIGLAVQAASLLDASNKRALGKLAYPLALARALVRMRPFRVWLGTAAGEKAMRSIAIGVGNGRFYGGGMVIEQAASIDDGRLDLYSVAPAGPLEMLRLAMQLPRGTFRALPHVHQGGGTELRLRTQRRMKVMADGELLTHTPVHFGVIARALQVRVPPAATDPSAPTG